MSRSIDTLAICAVRYALGRETYIVSDVIRAVAALDLEERAARVIARDVARGLREGRAGAAIDATQWQHLLDHLLERWPAAALEVEADARIHPGGRG